jgi:hypothetical protein
MAAQPEAHGGYAVNSQTLIVRQHAGHHQPAAYHTVVLPMHFMQ